jgi:hypothetical protein
VRYLNVAPLSQYPPNSACSLSVGDMLASCAREDGCARPERPLGGLPWPIATATVSGIGGVRSSPDRRARHRRESRAGG